MVNFVSVQIILSPPTGRDSQQTHEGGERTGMIVVLSTVLVLAMLVVCLFCYTYTSVGQTLVNTERLKLIQ